MTLDAQKINLWTQTIAIILAGMWAVWTFGLSEWRLSEKQTQHVTSKVEMKKVGSVFGHDVVKVTVNVKNEGVNQVHVLDSVLAIYDLSPIDGPYAADKWFESTANKQINDPNRWQHVALYDPPMGQKLVAVAGLFPSDWVFDPKEQAIRTFTFQVPCNDFRLLKAQLYVPITDEANNERSDMHWTVIQKKNKEGIPEDEVRETLLTYGFLCRWFGWFCDSHVEEIKNFDYGGWAHEHTEWLALEDKDCSKRRKPTEPPASE